MTVGGSLGASKDPSARGLAPTLVGDGFCEVFWNDLFFCRRQFVLKMVTTKNEQKRNMPLFEELRETSQGKLYWGSDSSVSWDVSLNSSKNGILRFFHLYTATTKDEKTQHATFRRRL